MANINIQNTSLKISAGTDRQFPSDPIPQVALSGRSLHDAMMLEFLAQSGIPYVIAVTKTDKLNKTERAESLAAIAEFPYAKGIDIIPFSSHTGEGKADLWKLILSHTGL